MELDLPKPIVISTLINRKYQKVEYEGIPIICYTCGKVGHLKDKCLLNKEKPQQGDRLIRHLVTLLLLLLLPM